MGTKTEYRTCPLCEATCGLELELDGREVVKARGDREDVFSAGFICPKGASIGELQSDPDRLTAPLVRRDGELVEASWEQAFEAIEAGLAPILADGDRNAVATYVGNPNAHTLDGQIHLQALLKTIGSRNVFSASSVDQMPKQVAVAHLFGAGLSVPIPDLDRTSHLLIIGANPLASNGSLMTAPDVRGRLRRIGERGGKIVVVDPRRSRTAELADEHHYIRPGRDAQLLAAIAETILSERLAAPGEHLESVCNGLDELAEQLAPFTPEAVAAGCGIEPGEIRRLARELAAAESAVVYARIGTTTQEYGTLASWLVDVLNVITGNLDRPGGAMFPLAAAGQSNALGEPGRGRGAKFARWSSRVRGLPEAFGELPVACLAEEIETPGQGQVRALLTIAGNPLRSTPNSGRLTAAIAGLEFRLSVDCYLNETSALADVVLPVPTPLERSHYDLAFYQLSVRNISRFTPASLPLREGMRSEWSSVLQLVGIFAGQGPDADTDAIDDLIALEAARRETATPGSPVEGMEPADVLAGLEPRRGPERILDLLLRCGPYGAGLNGAGGRGAGGFALSLDEIEAHPHGVDLGPLQPRLPELLRTPSGKVELCPAPIVADLPRLEASLHQGPPEMVLIGRRQMRSNNSWLHNLPHLVRGADRCTMLVCPEDAERLGLSHGAGARVSSRTGSVEVPVEVSDAIMPGVVSIPHGWGHDAPGARLRVAAAHSGVNSNLLADEDLVDPLSGNAVLNGIPVSVVPA